ncbi:MAG: hypothetical protein AMXMBFR37_09220 [Steroidobacteraceae bacterium]
MRGRLLVALLLAATSVHAAAPPHTVTELVREAQVRDADLAPDGRHIAIAVATVGNKSDEIAIIDLAADGAIGAQRRIALPEHQNIRIEWLLWATDRRLLASLVFDSALTGKDIRSQVSRDYISLPTRRVYALDADGGNFTVLFSGSRGILNRAVDLGRVIDLSEVDRGRVTMAAWVHGRFDLFSVDIYTGKATAIADGGSDTYWWEAENGQAVLRYDINDRRTTISVYGRASAGSDWTLLTRYARRDGRPDWEYAGDAPGPGKIYVRSRVGGEDKASIYVYDIATKTFGERIATHPDYDLNRAVSVRGRFAGVSFVGDRLQYLLEDKALQRHIDGIGKYFADAADVVITGFDDARARLLLRVDGPVAPGDYYYYDVASRDLKFLYAAFPGLEPERLAPTEVLRSPMRDGTSITSYLTKPRSAAGSLPLVVMPHGGPERRDSLGFDPFVQALAAQGWAVLQPNFRGSSGYGKAFAEAGYRQWSLRMQDDVTDAVRDLVARKVADPARIAIAGISYGGYAALAGAVVTPDLYRAAVARAGVSDLVAMQNWERRADGADSEVYKYWVKAIGDPKADEAALRAASPRLRASEIRIPVLLIHGVDDDNVPVRQSRMMRDALQKAGRTVRLIEVENEGHDGWSVGNDRKFVEETIAFLAPYLNQ